MRTQVVYDGNNRSYIILVKRFFFSPWRILCSRNKHNSPVRFFIYDSAFYSSKCINRNYLRVLRNRYCLQPLKK